MYHLYGIIATPSHQHEDDHRNSIGQIRARFPSRAATMDLVSHKGLTLFSSQIRSGRIGETELFLVGEIFNEDEIFRLARRQDHIAKALLDLYLQQGESVFTNINGSFAIIMLDHQTGKCLLINDQMGTFQLFYYATRDYLLVASELKFLFCHRGCPRQIDWTASLKRPIPFQIVNAERHQDAWFKDIHLLEDASILEWSPGLRHSIRPYWDPWNSHHHHASFKDAHSGSLETYVEEYIALLEDAVRLRTASPGSAYSMFSGGMDSTIIAAMAGKFNEVGTFSFATPATIKDGATEMCLRLAGDLNMTNTQILIPFDELVTDGQLWNRHILSMESPFAHKDAIGKVALHAAISAVHPEVTHILSGTGSDQLNGGLVRWFVPDAVEGEIESNWARVIEEIRTESLKTVIPHQYDTFWGSRDLLRQDYLSSMSPNPLPEYPWEEFVRGCLHANHFVLMWDELRSGAWSHRGVRFPFMDYRFVSFIQSVPRDYHAQLFFDKQILRQGAKTILPNYLTDRPKAPVHKPGDDSRMHMYKEILFGQDGKVLDELLETMQSKDMPIDRLAFETKARRLAEQPDLPGWTYLMHLAGLVTLGRLPDLNEDDIDMQKHIMPHVDILSNGSMKDIHPIRQKLSVLTPDEILSLPLVFCPECSLVSDVFNQTHFLVKDGELCYQIEDDNMDWQIFLRSVDGVSSSRAICAEKNLDEAAILEFLQISLEEGILSTYKSTAHHGTN